ncbi:MAG: leucine-rich repeat protein, partial [Blautia sp.]|nr:leucine-rich repeat protein [Blautia sp.]
TLSFQEEYMFPVDLDVKERYAIRVNANPEEEKEQIKVSVELLPFHSVLDSGTTPKGIKWELSGLDPKGFTGYNPNHDESWDGYYTRMTFKLKLSGSGPMDDYFINYQNRSESKPAPWNDMDYSQDIQELEIGSGITHIGNCAFVGIGMIKEVVIPEGVTSIGERAFLNMNRWNGGNEPVYGLQKVKLPSSLTSIGGGAFHGDRKLETVEYPGTLIRLRDICQGMYNVFDGASIWAQNTFTDIELKDANKKYTLYTDAAGIFRNGFRNFRPADFGLHAGTYTVTITADTKIHAVIEKVTLNEQGHVIDRGERVADFNGDAVNGTTYRFDVKLEENQAYNLSINATQLEPSSYTVSYRFDEKKEESLDLPKTSYKLTYSAKAQSFNLGATSKEKIKYSSDNSKVTVSSKGKVTVAKKFIGKAKITVKAGALKKSVTVTVNPQGAALSSLKSSKAKQLTVKWKKGTAMTGYQLQYADNKSFKSAKTKTAKKSATSVTLTGLTSGKTWYVRIRTYKTVNGTKYYSDWSATLQKKVK